MKNLNNVLKFDDFDNNWKAKTQKSTKRTDVGLDILNEQIDQKKSSMDKFLNMIGIGVIKEEGIEKIIAKNRFGRFICNSGVNDGIFKIISKDVYRLNDGD